jgi:hypothetical protein
VQGLPGPHGRSRRPRLSPDLRHEPFTPRLPRLLRERPLLAGLALALCGGFGNWLLTHFIVDWPGWTLFPSFLAAVLCLGTMVIGLGMATVCALEPVVSKMAADWDDDPVAALGVPPALQRKCEQLGFWTASDVAAAVTRGTFPWTSLDYDERQQIDRAGQRWQLALDAERAAKRKARRLFGNARGVSHHGPAGD